MHTDFIDSIHELLVPRLKPVFLILFGSQTGTAQRPTSDIDIAFYCQTEEPSPYETFLLAQELASVVNTDVDLINIRNATTIFQAQIYTHGQVIYSKNDHIRARAHMTALHMYTKLNEERQPVLNSIYKRGSVYDA